MGSVGIFRKSGEKSEKRWRKSVSVQKCQVIAEYKELVGSCADIPQSLELSRIIFFTAAAVTHQKMYIQHPVTQMVPKPSPLRWGFFEFGKVEWEIGDKQITGYIRI